jgi:cell wall-associated NlpC family hydrolase
LRPARLFSSVPFPLRSRLPAFALAAFVFGCSVGSAAAATAHPTRHDPRRPVPRKPSLGQRAAAIALKEVGVPYRWGGASPAGFDCSGLVYWAYGRLGVELSHSSYALYDEGRPVSRSRMRPGDLLFFFGLGHVGIYAGHGRMVHAPHSGTRVQVVNLRRSEYGRRLVAVRRIARR